MASVQRFEDLEVWKKARLFSKKVYVLSSQGTFAKDFALKDQINKSTGSVMDNFAEGFGRGGNKEFIVFLSYSKGSAAEVKSQLYRAFDRAHIFENTLNELLQEYETIGKMLGRLMSYLQSSSFRGSKFHEPLTLYHNLSNSDLEFDIDPNPTPDPNPKL
jgi:four helix bundle protein